MYKRQVYDWALSSSQQVPAPRNPDFNLGYKVSRMVADGVGLGLEYYNDKGPWNSFDPAGQQAKTLYYVLDFYRKPLPFNLGIGHGLNSSTDKWTVKAIFEVPFNL